MKFWETLKMRTKKTLSMSGQAPPIYCSSGIIACFFFHKFIASFNYFITQIYGQVLLPLQKRFQINCYLFLIPTSNTCSSVTRGLHCHWHSCWGSRVLGASLRWKLFLTYVRKTIAPKPLGTTTTSECTGATQSLRAIPLANNLAHANKNSGVESG